MHAKNIYIMRSFGFVVVDTVTALYVTVFQHNGIHYIYQNIFEYVLQMLNELYFFLYA